MFSTSCRQLRHTTMFDATSKDCVFSTSCRQLRQTTLFDATSRDCVFSTSCRQLRHTTVFDATSNGNAADLSQLSQGITHSPDCSTVLLSFFVIYSYTTHTGGIPTKKTHAHAHTWFVDVAKIKLVDYKSECILRSRRRSRLEFAH